MSEQPSRTLPPPARYFPVYPRPYRMEAGLAPFGRDFGNGERDRLYFQVDDQLENYRRVRARVGDAGQCVQRGDAEQERCLEDVLAWMNTTLRREHPELCGDVQLSYGDIAAAVQEDFVVIRRRADGRGEAIAVFVSFPSGWRPETIGGADFKKIHAPVPDFADVDAAVDSMVTAMVERGPYVRFVWTVTSDDELDHHPDRRPRIAWRDTTEGWLRVERQVTVPFAALGASLFLIRPYVYPFASLSAEQRRTLAIALEQMPAEVARYKGIDGEVKLNARRLLGER